MLKGLFEFIIVSAYDREALTCEILYKNEIVAEITQENKDLAIEIYPPREKSFWGIPLIDFQQALEDGKNFLRERFLWMIFIIIKLSKFIRRMVGVHIFALMGLFVDLWKNNDER